MHAELNRKDSSRVCPHIFISRTFRRKHPRIPAQFNHPPTPPTSVISMVLRGPVPPMVPSSTAVAVPAAAARSLPAGASLDLFNLTDVSVVTDPRIAAEYDALVKIVVLGDSAVGKSAVLRRYAVTRLPFSAFRESLPSGVQFCGRHLRGVVHLHNRRGFQDSNNADQQQGCQAAAVGHRWYAEIRLSVLFPVAS